MAHEFIVQNGLGLNFIPDDASINDAFLLREPTTGIVTKLPFIPVNRLQSLIPERLVTTDSNGFLTTSVFPDISFEEINQLDGVTSNIQDQLDGKVDFVNFIPNRAIVSDLTGQLVVSETTDEEVSFLVGVTSLIQPQIDSKEPIVIGAATTITQVDLNPNRALISSAAGKVAVSPTTAAELSYVSGVVSPIQTQLNTKLTANVVAPQLGHILYYTGSTWTNFPTGSAGEVLSFNGTTLDWITPTVNGLPAGGTTLQYLVKNSNTNYDAGWRTLILTDVTDVNATAAEVDILSGAIITNTELNYLDGVTSNIQVQLGTKLNNSLAYNSLFVGSSANTAIQLPPGAEDEVLTIVNGAPVWQPVIPPGDVSSGGSSTDNAIVRWNGTSGDSIQNSGVIIDDTNNISGVTSLTSGQIDILNQAPIRLHETGSTNYVGIRAAGVMGSDYTITLPASPPGSNTALVYDGVDYIWSSAVGGVSTFIALTDTDPTTYVGQAGKIVRVNAGETGLEFFTLGAGGTVTSVTGTANRITITGTPTIAPIVDIAATYVGQASINTLGNVTTGTWNADTISLLKGGTGATLSDPGLDSIFFWDDSAGSTAFLTTGATLAITGLTINVADAGITDAKLRNSAGLSVIGRSANSSGVPADIVASADTLVLRRSGTTLDFGTIVPAAMSFTFGPRLMGRHSSGAGTGEQIAVQNGLTLGAGSLKLGGNLVNDTTIDAANTWNFTFNNGNLFTVQASSIIFNNELPSTVFKIDNSTDQHFLHLGDSGGVTFNVGGDAFGDMYFRDLVGHFTPLQIGQPGMSLIVADASFPVWSNLIPELVAGTTYTFTAADNGKLKYFSNAGAITADIPVGLPVGWQVLVWRTPTSGVITFTSAGTLEGAGDSLDSPSTAASIIHRGGNVHQLAGALTGAGGGSGNVTSVGMSDLAGLFTVSGSPITNSGTFIPAFVNQTANHGFFGPLSGGAAAPSFRRQIVEDLPYEEFEDITGTTYTLLTTDRGKIKRTTNASGCTVNVPAGLPDGWACTVYRGLGAGVTTFTSSGTLEAAGTTLATAQTAAVIIHRNSNIHMILGALVGGGGTVTSVGMSVPSFLSVSGSPITGSGTLAVSLSGTALPATSGGTGLTSIGTANQILAVNNAGSALEYKTLSISSTAVANNVGLTLTGANSIVLNIPDASATVRGVVTTGTQTFNGAKSFGSAPAFTSITPGSVLFAGAGGLVSQDNLNFFWDDTTNSLGLGTTTPSALYKLDMFFSSGGSAPGGIRIRNNTGSQGSILDLLNDEGFNGSVMVTGSSGIGAAYQFARAMQINSGTLLNGMSLITQGDSPIFFVTNLNLDGVNSLRMVMMKEGIGIGGIGVSILPSAKLHIGAHSTAAGSAPIKLTEGVAMATPEDGSLEYHTDHLYFTIGSTRYQLDQQGGAGIGPGGATTEVQINTAGVFAGGKLFVPTAGNLTLGDTSFSGDRTISAVNTASNATLRFESQSGRFNFGSSNLQRFESAGTDDTLAFEYGAVGITNTPVYTFRTGDGTGGESFNGSSLIQSLMSYRANLNNQTGTAAFVQHASTIDLGARTATGAVYYATYGVGGLGDVIRLQKDGVLELGNRFNEPSPEANLAKIYADVSVNSTTSLAISVPQSVEAIGTFTASHKLKIKINGTWYWIQLDAV